MTRFLRQFAGLAALASIIGLHGVVWAQEDAETALQEAATKIESEENAASSDLRESVHENLESIQEDARTSKELRMARDAIESAQEQIAEPEPEIPPETEAVPDETTDQTAVAQPPEKRKIVERLEAVPVFLQSVPDRVPFIRDRGLIFFGRAELDYAYYSSGVTSDDSGFRVRSLRAGLAKAFEYNLSAKAEIDLTDGDSNFSDLYVRYRHKKWGLLTVGNQRIALAMANQTSRVSQTFMEDPLPAEAFGLGRRLALGWDLHKPRAGVHVSLFGADLNGSIGDSGYAGRAYFNPARSRFNLFHIGASLLSENMSRKTRFFAHPESRVTSQRLVDTGIYDDITQQYIGVLEFAGAKDSFMFRSEFFRARWNRRVESDPTFKGSYFQASWILTGEHFNYTQGKFIRIRPQNPKGAWEIGVRYSTVDLNNQGVTGGEEKNLTLGLNWYTARNQFRVMSNVIYVTTDKNAGDQNFFIFQLRGQLHW